MALPERLLASQRLSESYWQKWQPMEEPLLHHYTDAAGLHGIVTSREFRLTSVAYLNDATEHQQAGVAVRKALELLCAEAEKSDRQRRFYEFLGKVFDTALTMPRIDIDKNTFVGCFSTKNDSLSQWRAYGRGEGGFSIVFKASQLWDLKQNSELSPGYWLLPCDYDLDRITQLNKIYIEESLSECLNFDANMTDEFIAQKAAIDARWIGAGVKHPAFSEEAEWRLIYYGFDGPPPMVSHKPNSTLTPFIKFSLGRKEQVSQLIHEVWVGPQRHPELAASAARDFLRRELGVEIPIKISETPFRVL